MSVAAAVVAQRQTSDQLWMGPPDIAKNFQGIRELSGRVEVTSLITAYDSGDLHSICSARTDAEQTSIQLQQEHLAALDRQPAATRDNVDLVWTLYLLAQARAYSGQMAKATELLERARGVVATMKSFDQVPGGPAEFDALIGISELRRGELDNCLMHPNASRCIFPVTGAGMHEMKSGSEGAMMAFQRALTAMPDDLELRWLLNVAAMTLGKYPDQVPSQWVMPPERFASDEDPGRFTDIAPELGVEHPGRAGGAVMDDFNDDGRLDIVISSVDPCDPLHLFLQQPNGHFKEALDAGLDDQLGGINLV